MSAIIATIGINVLSNFSTDLLKHLRGEPVGYLDKPIARLSRFSSFEFNFMKGAPFIIQCQAQTRSSFRIDTPPALCSSLAKNQFLLRSFNAGIRTSLQATDHRLLAIP
jgi:hypothetical protein